MRRGQLDQPIRVALVGLAPLIRDVVTNVIAGQADMRVANVVESRGAIADSLRRESVDVLLLGVRSDAPMAECEALLGAAEPPQRVVGISADGRTMTVSELRPTTTELGSLSPVELLDLIRRGSRPAHEAHTADGRVPDDDRDLNERI